MKFTEFCFTYPFPFVLSRSNASKGSRVLIHGASGAVGLAATQIAKAHGISYAFIIGFNI